VSLELVVRHGLPRVAALLQRHLDAQLGQLDLLVRAREHDARRGVL
jgi:hypothetical protein